MTVEQILNNKLVAVLPGDAAMYVRLKGKYLERKVDFDKHVTRSRYKWCVLMDTCLCSKDDFLESVKVFSNMGLQTIDGFVGYWDNGSVVRIRI